MKSHNHIQLHIVLFSILLLIGQFNLLIHSAEHSFHDQETYCQIYIQCEKTSYGLIGYDLNSANTSNDTILTHQIASIWLSVPQKVYLARAPPSFL